MWITKKTTHPQRNLTRSYQRENWRIINKFQRSIKYIKFIEIAILIAINPNRGSLTIIQNQGSLSIRSYEGSLTITPLGDSLTIRPFWGSLQNKKIRNIINTQIKSKRKIT
jgi:hypothetical protein